MSDKVRVGWRDCDCLWTTKYCDEYHMRFAQIPREVLNRYTEDAS